MSTYITLVTNTCLSLPLKAGDSFVVRFFSSTIIKATKNYESKLKMSLKQSEAQQFSDFSNMYTPARFKILAELQDLKSLLQNLTCYCSDHSKWDQIALQEKAVKIIQNY